MNSFYGVFILALFVLELIYFTSVWFVKMWKKAVMAYFEVSQHREGQENHE
jgi:hypothetical protein